MSGTDARRQCPCSRCHRATIRRNRYHVLCPALVLIGVVLTVVADGGYVALGGWAVMLAGAGYGLLIHEDDGEIDHTNGRPTT